MDERESAAARVQRLFSGVSFSPHALQKLESFSADHALRHSPADAFEGWLIESFQRWDPLDLLGFTICNDDAEYRVEARLVRRSIESCATIESLSDSLLSIFQAQFLSGLPQERADWMARQIFEAWQEYPKNSGG